MYNSNPVEFKDLVGKTFTEIKNNGDELIFIVDDKTHYKQFHEQECCETVCIEDIEGDLNDLIETPILKAEEVSEEQSTENGSSTWTFYKLATKKGYVTIRWYGESNGYYSERVSFIQIDGKYEY